MKGVFHNFLDYNVCGVLGMEFTSKSQFVHGHKFGFFLKR